MAKLYFSGMVDEDSLSPEDLAEVRDALNLLSGVAVGKGFSFGLSNRAKALTPSGRPRTVTPPAERPLSPMLRRINALLPPKEAPVLVKDIARQTRFNEASVRTALSYLKERGLADSKRGDNGRAPTLWWAAENNA